MDLAQGVARVGVSPGVPEGAADLSPSLRVANL